MDRALDEPRRQKYKFSFVGSDWVEWLIVAVLCATAATTVGFMTGSLIAAAVVGFILLGAASAVIALV